MKRVVIVQRRLTHYREALFESLRARLADAGIGLDLLYGVGTPEEESKRDAGSLEWATPIPTHYWAGGKLCWQRFGGRLAGCDLLILTQENKLLQNHLRLLLPRKYRLAFWGHGANLQSDRPDGWRERYKRWSSRQPDWWFAYTRMSADLVEASGFPAGRVTILNNAVDTSVLARQRADVSVEDALGLRKALGIPETAPVGLYLGSLYRDKRLGFLIEACDRVRERVADFHLIVVGEGPERDSIQGAQTSRQWMHWVGARFGKDKALHLAVANLLLNPGLVGLGILDAFVCGVPLVTTDCGLHSPEIAYLENHRNGLMTQNTLDAYARAVAGLFDDPDALATLRAGCASAAAEYTLENMVGRFSAGIEQALESGLTT